MHLELLKDLKLMDFEGIYNVSSHPNTLYIVQKIYSQSVLPKRPVQWASLAPIEIGEVEQNLKGIDTQTACSPDGRKLAALKNVPVRVLTCLLNKWAYAGMLPTKLWEGRTTLIPKEAGMTDPAKFRPIGVSSLLVRLYHRILA